MSCWSGWRAPHKEKLTFSLPTLMVIVRICAGSSAYKALLLLAVVTPASLAPAPAVPAPAAANLDDDTVEEEGAKAWSRPSNTRSRLRLLVRPVDMLCGSGVRWR